MSFDPCSDVAPTAALSTPRLFAAGDSAAPAGLVRHGPHSAQRALVEEFVRREFRTHFGARIRHFMPELLGLHAKGGAIRAAVGCRAAAAERLFLETYTREPIEIALAKRNGFWVPRERIVEIGSLACRSASAAIAIIRALVPHLLGAGYSWVVFTGADTVMNVFHHLGLTPRELCPADPLLLGAARHDWGTYYDHDPHVMAGRIEAGASALYPLRARRPQ
ncbi:MAG TPA: thermostable hemolysin [Gammaproteobacteria bacterium]|nr:thermostable hemolysin [Gammaproteobacteria bacterium]